MKLPSVMPEAANSFLRQRARHTFLLAAVAVLSGCATVSFDAPKSESTYFTDTAQTELGNWSARWVDEHDGASGFYPLLRGRDALAARLELAERAQKSIDLQYFLMKDDKAGSVIGKSLLLAADRGVRIRFLLDDIFTSASDRNLLLLNEHPNIEVRLFNPISRRGLSSLNFIFDFRRANRRMHNKSFSVDNAVSIVGGRNIAEEYFELKDSEVFIDFDVLAFGPIVSEVSDSFDDFWNHSQALPIEYVAKPNKNETLADFRASTGQDLRVLYDDLFPGAIENTSLKDIHEEKLPLFPASAIVIADSPDKLQVRVDPEHQKVRNEMRELLLSAEQELLVVSPYYVPLDDGVQFVRDKVSRGIRSVMVTNSLASNNHIAVHAGYSKYRLELIRAGMELYETRASAASLMPDSEDGSEQMTLHTKLLIVDRRYTVVGSPNIDPRSLEINAEMALVIDSEPLARSIAERIDGLLADMTYRVVENPSGKLEWQGRIDGQDVVETKEPLSGRWRRFKAWFLKIVPDRQL